ncbi:MULTISPECIES: hypothetical protein [unclassified Kribbella]|uniref:hypothetical protein n=1 Tax=unclassified Kribbella TaxID=2644121 RepID=UPI00340215F0
MSTTTMIRYQTTPETAARNRELIEQVLAALPAFQEFQHTIRDRLAVAPDRTAASELGSFHP